MWTKNSESIQVYVVERAGPAPATGACSWCCSSSHCLFCVGARRLWAQQDRSLAYRPSTFSTVRSRPPSSSRCCSVLKSSTRAPRAAWLDLMGSRPPARRSAAAAEDAAAVDAIGGLSPGPRLLPPKDRCTWRPTATSSTGWRSCPVAHRCCVVSLALQQDSRRSREGLRWLDARHRLWRPGGVPGLRCRHRRQPHRQRRLCGSGGRRDAHLHLRGDSVLGWGDADAERSCGVVLLTRTHELDISASSGSMSTPSV